MLHGIIPWLLRGLLALVSSAEVVMGVCHDVEVGSYRAFYDVWCSERCLCIVQASRFLSPSETRSVGNLLGSCIWWRLSTRLRCSGSVLLLL
jgi:hypothetical protein